LKLRGQHPRWHGIGGVLDDIESLAGTLDLARVLDPKAVAAGREGRDRTGRQPPLLLAFVGHHGECTLTARGVEQARRRGGREAVGVQNDRVHRPHDLDVDVDDAGEARRCRVERELEPIVRRADILGEPAARGVKLESRGIGARQERSHHPHEGCRYRTSP
jgi:hypothetical protein